MSFMQPRWKMSMKPNPVRAVGREGSRAQPWVVAEAGPGWAAMFPEPSDRPSIAGEKTDLQQFCSSLWH